MLLQFAKLEDAKAAQSLNGKLELAGRTIKVVLYLRSFGVDYLSLPSNLTILHLILLIICVYSSVPISMIFEGLCLYVWD